MLDFEGPLDENLRRDLTIVPTRVLPRAERPCQHAEWVDDLFPTGKPMLSLRDVEEQAPVYSRGGRS